MAASEKDSFDVTFSFDEIQVSPPLDNQVATTSEESQTNSGSAHNTGHNEPDRTIAHTFKLRTDFEVLFKLPTNFTKVEAARLARFVTSLPFEGEMSD